MAVIFALTAQSTVQAQTSDFDNAFAPRGAEARVSLTIPFGGDTKRAKSKPQLALVGRQYQSNRQSIDWAVKSSAHAAEFTETRLALTLSAQPELRFNDQLIYAPAAEQEELSDEVKTAGKFALGAGLITLAAVVVFLGVFLITYDGDGT